MKPKPEAGGERTIASTKDALKICRSGERERRILRKIAPSALVGGWLESPVARVDMQSNNSVQ